MRRNNTARLHGQLAQETLDVLATTPLPRVRVGLDTHAAGAGGRHWVLFEGERVRDLAAYLSAAGSAQVPLGAVVFGSLVHERQQSLITDLANVTFTTFQEVRRRAEDLRKSGGVLRPVAGPTHSLRAGYRYHTCIYLGGALDVASLGAKLRDGRIVVTATLDTGEAGALGRHELVFAEPEVQASLRAVRAVKVGTVEANVEGTLWTMGGWTQVVVSAVEVRVRG